MEKENIIIDKTFNNLAGEFVEILNDTIAKERAKTELWKKRAYILKQKYGHCQKHDHDDRRGYNIWEYLEGIECGECVDEQKTIKDEQDRISETPKGTYNRNK